MAIFQNLKFTFSLPRDHIISANLIRRKSDRMMDGGKDNRCHGMCAQLSQGRRCRKLVDATREKEINKLRAKRNLMGRAQRIFDLGNKRKRNSAYQFQNYN